VINDFHSDATAVSDAARDSLIQQLLKSYPDLKRYLTKRLGSADLATETLQDTYIRLSRTEFAEEIRNPIAYLYRMSANIGSSRVRDEARHLSAADVETLLQIPDDTPDPFRVAEGRSRVAAMERALRQMPERRRRIFQRAWVDGAPHAVIASEFQLAIRTIRHELQLATEHIHNATK
jgi:RNA polymerase sigma-70 factor (ECF subfamily)